MATTITVSLPSTVGRPIPELPGTFSKPTSGVPDTVILVHVVLLPEKIEALVEERRETVVEKREGRIPGASKLTRVRIDTRKDIAGRKTVTAIPKGILWSIDPSFKVVREVPDLARLK